MIIESLALIHSFNRIKIIIIDRCKGKPFKHRWHIDGVYSIFINVGFDSNRIHD